ncbi:phosphoenolpyruvate--protein phosphotransferase [Desulfovibrio sp. OttesenSCG-928-G15]|nr:phosphoenolpyruvate--protein phosphotransferase [Desulfovibrio sp. OttesenSCG-928-G15]
MAHATLHGIAVSSGIAIGKAYVVNRAPGGVRHDQVSLDAVEDEAKRLQSAITLVCADFEAARDRMTSEAAFHVDIVEAHLLICRDPKLAGEALRRIREQRMNAEWALEESVARLAESFSKLSLPYIRDRIEDVRLVAARVQSYLDGGRAELDPTRAGILIAYDLTPADVAGLAPTSITSFAIEQGGKTSHTGIMGRSLRIPAVVGLSGLTEEVRDGDTVVVDGIRGRVVINPDAVELGDYQVLQEQYAEYEKRIQIYAHKPAETEDGRRLTILANVETAAETDAVLACGGEGVGLVRTEFAYITRPGLPSEEELYRDYSALVQSLSPRKVIFRTLDIGGDKVFTDRTPLDEANPAMGMRGIRYCLRHQDIFRTQLRAILRASAHGNAAIMFPMISGLSELRVAKSILAEASQELQNNNTPYNPDISVGIMVELPSAVMVADMLAKEVDFFSIGTNDLIQYSLGVDRGNKHVAHMHQPLHPSIVRSIKTTVDMAHRAGIAVSVCGEMAADPYCIPILIGMEVDEISLAPQSIPAMKHLVRNSSLEECRELLTSALNAPTVAHINNLARQAVYNRFPEDVSFFASQTDTE